MSVFPRVLVDESHSEAWSLDPQTAARINPAQPADASYEQAAEALRHRGFEVSAHSSGALDSAALEEADVLVVAHPADASTERASGTGDPTFTPAELDAIDAVVTRAHALLRLDPGHEPGCRLLLRALVRRGERGEALRIYHQLTAALRELGAEPDPATVAAARPLTGLSEAGRRIRAGSTGRTSTRT